jgi:hypothetical protein
VPADATVGFQSATALVLPSVIDTVPVCSRGRVARGFGLRAERVVGVVRIGDRPARAGNNQSLFRLVNEQVRELNERLGGGRAAAFEWLCECANSECVERISMTRDEYAAVRASPIRFVVAAGQQHVWADVERVVLERNGFWVVEKFGEAAEAANPDGSRV